MASKNNQGWLTKSAGTWYFWSPEMCHAKSLRFSGYAADLWAAGVCLYVLATGSVPFFSLNPAELFEQIEKAKVNYEGLGLSDSLQDLLGKMLRKDPSTRPGVGECLTHVFCADGRSERVEELGINLAESEEHIVLAQNGVDAATAATVLPNTEATSKMLKHNPDSAASDIASAGATVRRRSRPDILRENSDEMMQHMNSFHF